MKDALKIAKIIYRYFFEEISQKEGDILEEWMMENEVHRKLLQKFQKKEYIDEKAFQYEGFSIQKGFEKFKERQQREKRRSVWIRKVSVAAAFCGIVGVSALLLWDSGNHENPIIQSGISIMPGTSRAVLILENGQSIQLTRDSSLRVMEKSIVITVKDNLVVYPKEDTVKTEAINRMITPRGGEYSLVLSDGTRVWLNADSELRYPVKFRNDCREVEIKGEAYFEVVKNAARPFVVNTNGMKIQVLGTSFNVRVYKDEFQRTTLVEGSVVVSYKEQRMKIIPGQQVVLNKEYLEMRNVDTQIYTGWKDGLFVFDDQLLSEVLRELERWYDVNIFITNPEIGQLKFTGNFPRYENIGRVLNLIELAACVKCEVKDRTIVFRLDN